jgi:hypothetical protein
MAYGQIHSQFSPYGICGGESCLERASLQAR